MKRGKQRRGELQAKKAANRESERLALIAAKRREGVAVNVENLAPYNSYGVPEFVEREFYVDVDFTCKECSREDTWTATQQKWWYEVAKGYVYSTAKLCRACRRRKRDRKSKARRVHMEGLERKKNE